jgi:hypothetical protein
MRNVSASGFVRATASRLDLDRTMSFARGSGANAMAPAARSAIKPAFSRQPVPIASNGAFDYVLVAARKPA